MSELDPSSRKPAWLQIFGQVRRDASEFNRARRARREARSAVERVAKDKSEDEIRELLLREYKKRNVKPPSQPLFGNVVATITTDDPAERKRLADKRKELLRENLSELRKTVKNILP
jgi:hypothetical protein